MDALPDDALALVRSIEARLAQADGLGASLENGGDDAFVVAETRRRYLPDTLAAYTAIPREARTYPGFDGRSPHDHLLDQLRTLDAGIAVRVDALATRQRGALAANGAFLHERLGATPDVAPLAGDDTSTPAVLMQNLFAPARATVDARAALDVLGARLAQAFPQIVQFQRAGLFGRGPIERLQIDVPIDGTVAFRYFLAAGRGNTLEASVAKTVRGVTLKTLPCTFTQWIDGLYEDLGGYAERDAHARESLARVFS